MNMENPLENRVIVCRTFPERKIHSYLEQPKFAASTPKVPVTEYIAVTNEICDRLGENADGVDCSEYYQKTKDLLEDYKGNCAFHPNIPKMEREAIKTLKEDNTYNLGKYLLSLSYSLFSR